MGLFITSYYYDPLTRTRARDIFERVLYKARCRNDELHTGECRTRSQAEETILTERRESRPLSVPLMPFACLPWPEVLQPHVLYLLR